MKWKDVYTLDQTAQLLPQIPLAACIHNNTMRHFSIYIGVMMSHTRVLIFCQQFKILFSLT
jgi:hypothetical protein